MGRKLNPHVKILTHKEAVELFVQKGISPDEVLMKNSLDNLDGFRYNTINGSFMLPTGTFPKGISKKLIRQDVVAADQDEETPFMKAWKLWPLEDRENIEKTGLLRIAMARNESELDKAMQIYANYLTAKKKHIEVEQEPVEPVIGNLELMKSLIEKQEQLKDL